MACKEMFEKMREESKMHEELLNQKIKEGNDKLKGILQKIKDIINGSYIHLKLVLGEINDFLYEYPPSGLTKSLPMFALYIEVFEEMKKVTDAIVKNKKSTLTELTEALSSIKSKNSTLSKDYLKYLEYVIYKC